MLFRSRIALALVGRDRSFDLIRGAGREVDVEHNAFRPARVEQLAHELSPVAHRRLPIGRARLGAPFRLERQAHGHRRDAEQSALDRAGDLIGIFLGVEILSVALYVLCALEVWREKSLEAGLKYLIIGSLGSTFSPLTETGTPLSTASIAGPIGIGVRHGWRPVGDPMTATSSDGVIVTSDLA